MSVAVKRCPVHPHFEPLQPSKWPRRLIVGYLVVAAVVILGVAHALDMPW
jgi:hypothetical protein